MATSASGVSPLSQALQSLGVERPAPAAQMDPKSAFEGLARQTNVPANVLMALDEAEGGGADLDRARRNADFLGKRLAGGAKLDDVVAEMAGDAERGAALMSRSYDIADALYPEQAAPKAAPGIGTDLKDLGKLGVAGAVNMTGGALQALGAVADDAIRAGARAELEASGGDPAQVQGESIVRSGSRAAADAVRGAGDAVAGSISDRMKQAMEGTRFEGELFSPSTWSAGDDPSIRGVLGHTAQGLGSMIPVAAASAVAGPTGAAVMGGLGAAGEGAQSGRDFVQAARGREGEAGPAAIEAMPAFRALLDQGLSPDEAAAELAGLTESEAAAWQAIPGTLGGAATGKILSRAEGMLNAGGRAARAAKKGLAGAIEEGAQEAAEGMASQQGIAAATGADVNTQQDSFGNFVLGALSGGVMGAGAGLVGPGQTDSEQSGDATGDAPLGDGDSGGPDVPLLPAPENGGTIFGMSQAQQEPGNSRPDAEAEAERIFRAQPDTMDMPADAPILPEIDGEFTEIPPISDTGPDGSGAGAVAAPGVAAPLSGAPGAAATTPIPAQPAGPVERLALGIAAATPPAPAARFPDQRPGSAVRFGDTASGQIIDGVFLGETEAGARVRVQGREIDLTPEQFDALRDAAPQIEDARKQAEKAAKDAAKAKPAQEAPADVEPVSAAQWPEQGAGNTDVRLGNDGPDLGAGTTPGGAPVPQGLQGVQDLAGGRGTAAGTRNDNQQDGMGGVVLADDAGKLGTALTNARASGEVEHVTKKGKTKTGYVLQGVTKAEADKIDAYSFRKNGGFFVNTDRADEWAAKAVGDQVNASTIDAGLDPAQSPSDQRSTNTEPLGNGPLAHALSQKGKDVGSRDRQHMKLTHVVSAINDPQILKSVVESVPVDVMNVLMGQKVSPEALLKNPAMLAHRLSVPSDKPIPEPVRAFLDALPASVGGLTAGGRAEETGLNSGSGAVKLPRDGGSAGAAGGADLWHGKVLGQHVTINHNPSEKQKEAGNYNKGAVRWNGLDLSIENAKGSERRGKGPDGAEWSVTMPADYGYFRGTEGADGDHVDFYMGDVPDSDYVLIVDQVDADTGKFDEHKVITGTTARGAALGLYRDSFSDGRGDARIGAITETTVEGMKAWLKGGQMRRPAAGRLDYPFKGRAKAQAKKAAAAPAGSEKLGQWGALSQPEMSKPKRRKMGEKGYSREDAVADLHELEGQQSANGMVADARLGERIAKLRDMIQRWDSIEAEKAKRAEADETPPSRVTYDGPVPDGFKKVDSRYFTEKEDMGNETTHQYTVQGTNFGKGFRAFRTAFHKQHGSMATELGHFDTFEDAIAATRADREAYAKAHRKDTVQAKPKASVSATTGLTEAEEARLAALKAKLAGKLRNQVNSGLDPEILGIAVEMTGLYVKGGMRKFGAILRNFMADTGLTASQSQRYLRAAYGDVRDEMDLAGEDVSGMAEVRASLAEESKPDQEPPAPQKRPLIQYVAKVIGGIDPTGTIAAELNHRGITTRTAPGLFRKGGHMDLDNVPASEHPDLAALVGTDDTGNYLDAGAIVEGIAEEVAGRPQPLGEQAELQERAQAVDKALAHIRDQEADHIIVPRGDDPRGATERKDAIARALGDFLDKYAQDSLTGAERKTIIETLNLDGSEIENAVEDAIMRRPLDEPGTAEGEDADIPFGDVGGDPQPGTAGSAPDGSEAEAFDFGRMPSQEPGTTGQGEVNGPASGSENAALAGSRGAKGGRRGNGRASVSVTGPQGLDSALAEGVAGGGEPTGSIESADAGGAGPVGSVVSGNDGRPEGGNEPGRSAGAGSTRLARPQRDKPVAPTGRPDYILTDPERIVGGGPKARFARNRAALEAMQSIESEGRDPTPEELDSIAGYIGWGSFGQELFQGSWERPVYRDGWKAENDWLREHLGEAKWKSAQGSIINAHYTDPPTVMAMWDMVRAMGFNGGRVLEPSMGIGNFFSMMPADLAARSDRTGIELDKQTGAMAKLLFPHANISIKGYQDSATPDDFYDLVIGNWPFASQSPADRRYDRLGPSLHDYFFLKALDQTRPGGLVVGITSAGTMDKKGRATRIELAKKADLVAAYRLPSGAFEGYAGTSVVTDIIILKKRAEPNANAADEAWIGTADYAAPAGTIHVNRYFLENPDNVLGRLDFGSGSTYGRAAMIVHRPADLFERLNAIRTALPSDAFTPISRGNEPRFIQNMTTDRQGSITTGPDGKGLYVVQGERLVNLSDVTSYEVKDAKETESREKQIRSLVDMRRAYGALLDAERLGEDAEAPRKRLKALFDAFRKAFGTIADSFGIKVLGKVNDPFAPALRSLERPDGTPATILTRSTMRGAVALENPTVADAYALNRNQTTTLDMEAVAKAAGVSVEDATDELVEAGAVLRIPGGGVEPKDTYLSGNVRRKLREVEDAISRGETDLADTAEKLRAVQPAPVPYYEIEARLGAPWVTADYYRQFIADMIGLKSIDAQQVDIRPVGGAWKVTFKDRSLNRRPEARSGYGVSGYPFSMLFGAAMGNRPITLKTKDEDGKDVVDEKRSAEANAAATKIRERFQEWVWEDAERTLALETAYNDAMRAIADPQYDGDFLTFPGMALTRGESPFNLRKHQRDAIWRGIYNERGLYAHEVGTGKTYTMAGIAVESRRYGKAKKPLILAHNANSAAVYAEAQEMYPGGRFLFVDNLDKGNIATTMQRIASDDWDAVIMPHSVMPRVGFREETLMALAAEEIAALEQEALDAAEEDGVELDLADMDDADAMKRVRSVTAKNLVKQRNAILERIRKSANRASKEGAIPFEELGIDMILVDEAHEFKKPPIATRMQIKGLNTQASDRSIALKLMSDYVKSRRGGTGIHLFTGTPITNALNEIFNMMNYVMDAEMEREGVKSWDMWFNTFADSSTDVEVQSTGEFEAVTRLAQFVNVSELRRMAGQVLDIVFASDMPEFKPRETKSGKTLNDPTLTDAERDELLNGRTENAIGRPYKLVRTDVGQMSPAQRSVMDQVVQWSRNWKQADKKKRREYMLSGSEESPIIHEGIAAKASLDVRSYDARLPDHPDNKVSRATRNIMHHYRESKDGAQVVFVETGYNEKAKPGHGAPFSLVKDLIGKLVAAGIPETQIAVVAGGVKAEKKKAIADAVNAGKIRVVIGQTGTLGVGVNMQKRLRAMHHLDAPWMPGDLEQRNGRGERQGNTWNTVIEYRYLTEGIDGRRWQVLAIKDRFIKAFLRADDSVRVIEGDAVDTSEGDEGGIAATLSEATGDPRLLQRAKLQKDVERLEVRERQHTIGIAQAMKAARKEREEASSREALMADYRRNAELATAARDSGKFTAEIGGTTFTERKDAAEAFKEAVDKLAQGSRDAIVAKVQGFEVRATKRFIDGIAPELWVKGSGKVNYEMGKPTLASAEAAIRNMIGLADHVARTVKEAREAAERLEAQAKRPFAQAERLAARRKLLADIEADMEANPAAPPAWLRHGAPVGTDVFVEGKPREVQGHRWTNDGYFVVTEEGLVPYLEAKAENGTSIYDEHEFESPVKDSAAKVDEQRQADEKESRFRRSEDMTPADARAVNEAARAELEKVGLAGRVSVEATAKGRAGVTGSYLGGVIRIIRPGGNWKHTLDHEIIHALRDPSLWGARYGMFTAEEWHALVKAARADKGIRDRVTAAYGDLDTPAQSEEMVAELYADWAKARRETPPGPLRSAFEKVRSFFRAVASALRGEGFVDAAQVMERIASGEIGGRGPDGSSSGRGDGAAQYQRDGHTTDIQSVIEAARSPGHAPQRAETGKTADWVVDAAREAGVDLDGLAHVIDGSAVRHIFGRHGNDKAEARRGQTAVTESDILALGDVIADPDGVAFGSQTRIGRPAVIYAKVMPDNTVLLVEELRNKRGEAAVNTMWKMASAAKDAYALERILLSNARNDSGAEIKVFTKEEFVKEQRDLSALKDQLSRSGARAKGMIGDLHWKKAPGFFSSLLTDAMGKNDIMNILALVPGNPLFEELGKGLPAAQKYLREKQTMDAWRNDWQARAAAVVDGWTKQARKNPEANDRLMDLMHASTLAGVDPSREGSWRRPVDDEARRALKQPNLSPERQVWAQGVIRAANDRERIWQRLKDDFDALPAEFRDLYQQIRDEYAAMADEQDAALMSNIRTASKIAVKRADREHRKELQRIRDEGLTGEARAAALEKANKRKTDAHARAARGGGARLQQLRQMFESNRLEGPYFPLARFGNYFVTIRDDDGKVTSFSRFQTEREQRAWIDSATERGLGKVEHGVLGGDANLKGKVDPTFVAEVESLLADAGASDEMMDAVWQRWLETLPDQSVRTNRIHRKGRLGFNKDATRAFSSAMFHGAHQTARLRHGLEMEDALDDAEEQAKHEPNPNRAGFVVREMRQRHAFTMSPTNNPLVSAASGLAFVWYLGMSPASAIVNLSQTTIVGVPVMAARFKRAGVTGTTAELARALRDFGAGRGWSEKSDRLSADEKAAMKAGYDRGVIDKTQSHDLAAVAESGVEYNPTREKVMRVIGWGFHHTERLNREVTFLAAYRMARAEGMGQPEAVDEASRQVWKVHFDYQNTSRPRVMQSDMGKILTTFRNFTVNMLYRLFRDAHQSFAGADAETRREARAQLIGISLSMFAHAGIKGVWGFGLLSMLLGAFLPGDDDDFENWLQDALLVEGDGAGVAAWNWTMGMVLNGAPGTVLDTDLTGRIGMPDLWFRGSHKDLEGKDLWSYYVEQVAGPVAGIGGSVATGLSMIADGEWQRGAEKVVPKFAANLVKSARYVEDGVTTYNGDSIIDSVNPYEALTTAMGFTPARVAERYRANTWLKNQEAKITSQRKSLMSDIGKSIKAGNGVTPELAQQVKAWNIKYPFYPITASGLRQSMASRQRLSNRSEGGVTLNPRLDQYLRTEVAPAYR